jgi:DNA polymerase III subunit delta
MLIFLYGPDTYRLSKKLAEIIEEYRKRKSGDFLVVDARAEGGGKFFAAIRQNSLFQEKKFIVAKDPIANKDFKEELIERMEELVSSGHNIVFCQEGKVLKTDRLLAAFKKNGQAMEFNPLAGEKLASWIEAEFAAIGSRIEPRAAALLAQRAGDDLWNLANEIQKIGHYLFSKEITTSDIEKNVATARELNIFTTVDAIAQRDRKQALVLLKGHIAKGDHPLYLLAMMATQFKNLLLVKTCAEEGSPASRLGIHPYVLGKTTAQARRFKIEEIKKIYGLICRADVDIKTGRIEAEAGLDLLVSQI